MFFVLRLMVVTFFLYRQAPTAGETLGVFFFLTFYGFNNVYVRFQVSRLTASRFTDFKVSVFFFSFYGFNFFKVSVYSW